MVIRGVLYYGHRQEPQNHAKDCLLGATNVNAHTWHRQCHLRAAISLTLQFSDRGLNILYAPLLIISATPPLVTVTDHVHGFRISSWTIWTSQQIVHTRNVLPVWNSPSNKLLLGFDFKRQRYDRSQWQSASGIFKFSPIRPVISVHHWSIVKTLLSMLTLFGCRHHCVRPPGRACHSFISNR